MPERSRSAKGRGATGRTVARQPPRRQMEMAAIVADLGATGIAITALPGPENRLPKRALQILAAWLDEVTDPRNKLAVVEALTTAGAQGIAPPVLLGQVRRTRSPAVRDAVFRALAVTATAVDADAVKSLYLNPRYEACRHWLSP